MQVRQEAVSDGFDGKKLALTEMHRSGILRFAQLRFLFPPVTTQNNSSMYTQVSKESSRKLLIGILTTFLLALLGTGFALFYLGAFKQPVLEKITTPGYRMVYVNHIGPYNEIKDIFKEIETKLKEAHIAPIAAAALFLDDSGVVAMDQQRSMVGYLIKDDDQSPSFLNEEKLLSQEVIQATFDGSPVVGSYKAYPAMKQWSIDNHYQLSLPSMEIYYPDGHVVYQLPISLKSN
jgi:AraC family transcriptional regulator